MLSVFKEGYHSSVQTPLIRQSKLCVQVVNDLKIAAKLQPESGTACEIRRLIPCKAVKCAPLAARPATTGEAIRPKIVHKNAGSLARTKKQGIDPEGPAGRQQLQEGFAHRKKRISWRAQFRSRYDRSYVFFVAAPRGVSMVDSKRVTTC